MRGLQRPGLVAGRCQPPAKRRDRVVRARHHGQPSGVLGGDAKAGTGVGHHRRQFNGGQRYGQHRATGLGLHQPAAQGHCGQRIGQRDHARQTGRHVFAQAVADHRLRHHAPVHPQPRQRVLDHKQRRLRMLGALQPGGSTGVAVAARAFFGVKQLAQVQAQVRLQQHSTTVDLVAEGRVRGVQPAGHARVLRALAAEHEDHLGLRARTGAGNQLLRRGPGKNVGRLGSVAADREAPLLEQSPASQQRVGDVGQLGALPHGQVGPKAAGGRIQGRRRARRQHQQVRHVRLRGRRRHKRRRWRLLQHHMRVRAANTECADAGAPGLAAGRRRPVGQGRIDVERPVVEGQLGVRRLEEQAGRQAPFTQAQHRLHEAGNAGGGVQMADIGFERAQRHRAPGQRAAVGLIQRGQLDRVAQHGAGAMGLDITDATGRRAGTAQRLGDAGSLPGDAGRGEAHLVGAVVVDRPAAHHGVHPVAVGQRVGQALEHHHRETVTADTAVGTGVERAAMAVARADTTLLVDITGDHRYTNRHAPGQCHIAAAGGQALAGLGQRHQRS